MDILKTQLRVAVLEAQLKFLIVFVPWPDTRITVHEQLLSLQVGKHVWIVYDQLILRQQLVSCAHCFMLLCTSRWRSNTGRCYVPKGVWHIFPSTTEPLHICSEMCQVCISILHPPGTDRFNDQDGTPTFPTPRVHQRVRPVLDRSRRVHQRPVAPPHAWCTKSWVREMHTKAEGKPKEHRRDQLSIPGSKDVASDSLPLLSTRWV